MGHHGNSFISFGAAAAVGGWVEIGRTTLGSAGDSIAVSGLANKRYIMILTDAIASGNITVRGRLNADSGSNYARRQSNNGGGDTTGVNVTEFIYGPGTDSATNNFAVSYLANLASKEKLILNHSTKTATGASNAPDRKEDVAKFANTSDAFDEWECRNDSSGSYATGSEVVVLGWDPSDTHTTNFWEELDSVSLSSTTDTFNSNTFTAKKYLWVQLFANYTGDTNTTVTFNSDTGTSYSQRQSFSGGADSTTVNQTNFNLQDSGVKNQMFENMFIINNASNEKLIIAHQMSTSDGASLAPSRAEHVAKWTNTSDQITSIQFTQVNAGSYISGSEMRIWGSN